MLGYLALLAGLTALLLRGSARRWIDAPRLLLMALALWSFSAVYTRIGGDGLEYYVALRSTLLDRDLDFENDLAGLGTQVPADE